MDNNKRLLRLGVIGCGAIVRGQHIRAIRKSDQLEITAIADPLAQSAADGAAAGLGVPVAYGSTAHRKDPRVRRFMDCHYYPDPESMLAAEDLDAVLIATPNNTHPAIARRCVEAGKHIFCEKPVAFTVEEHDTLQAAAAARSLVFQVGLVFRYSDVFRHARDLIQYEVGAPPLMMFINEFRPFAFQPWRYSREITGGMFVEKNCHHFDLFNWMLGDAVRPRRVVAFGGQHVLKDEPRVVPCLRTDELLPASDIIDHGWVLVEYENGVRAQLGISFFCPWGREFRMGIMGEFWKLDIYEMDRLVYLHQGPGEGEDRQEKYVQRFPPDPSGRQWRQVDGADPEAGFMHTGAVRQWIDFAACVRSNTEPDCNLIRARESIRVAQAAQQSLDEGRVVVL